MLQQHVSPKVEGASETNSDDSIPVFSTPDPTRLRDAVTALLEEEVGANEDLRPLLSLLKQHGQAQ